MVGTTLADVLPLSWTITPHRDRDRFLYKIVYKTRVDRVGTRTERVKIALVFSTQFYRLPRKKSLQAQEGFFSSKFVLLPCGKYSTCAVEKFEDIFYPISRAFGLLCR